MGILWWRHNAMISWTGLRNFEKKFCNRIPGRGRYSRFQVTGMIEWGQKSNPKKSLDQNLTSKQSHAEFPNHKISRGTTPPKSSDCFEYPKKSLLQSSYPKKYLPKMKLLLPKKSHKLKNFKPPKNPSIIPVTWNPECPPGNRIANVKAWAHFLYQLWISE